MAEYKLYYFNSKGRAEVARLIFALAGQHYDDIRIAKEDWPKHKADMPFGQVPVLEVVEHGNSWKLAQSAAIYRYLGHKFGFAGKNLEENATIDSYSDLINDMLAGFIKAHHESDETKKKELFQKFFSEDIHQFLKLFEKALGDSKNGYFVGDNVTWLDLYFAVLWDWIPSETRELIFSKYPFCKAHNSKVLSLPKIAEWIEKRPVTEM